MWLYGTENRKLFTTVFIQFRKLAVWVPYKETYSLHLGIELIGLQGSHSFYPI